MTDINCINMSFQELGKLKIIGAGTEGKVFNYNKDYLIKIYRKSIYSNQEFNKLLQKETKIYDKNKVKFIDKEEIQYYQNTNFEEIRINSSDAIKMIIEKQKYINRTVLPNGIVYLDNKFAGLLLKRVNGIQIHKLTGMPLPFKYKVIKELLLDIEELMNNNVYHIDLHNSPYCTNSYIDCNNKTAFINGHSHIFVNPINHKTHIIDLDGKSTSYKERKDEYLEQACINNLNILFTEFLYEIDRDELKENDEIFYELKKQNVNQNLAKKIAYNEFSNFKEVKKLMKI